MNDSTSGGTLPILEATRDAYREGERSGFKAGLLVAAKALCPECNKGRQSRLKIGEWSHFEPLSHGWSNRTRCKAGRMHDLIAEQGKENVG